jgi:putative endonuclease
MKTYFVYILASKKNGTLYIGMTSNLIRRVYEHKNDVRESFTQKYGCTPWFIMSIQTM